MIFRKYLVWPPLLGDDLGPHIYTTKWAAVGCDLLCSSQVVDLHANISQLDGMNEYIDRIVRSFCVLLIKFIFGYNFICCRNENKRILH